jgi:hypothetical protein
MEVSVQHIFFVGILSQLRPNLAAESWDVLLDTPITRLSPSADPPSRSAKVLTVSDA